MRRKTCAIVVTRQPWFDSENHYHKDTFRSRSRSFKTFEIDQASLSPLYWLVNRVQFQF